MGDSAGEVEPRPHGEYEKFEKEWKLLLDMGLTSLDRIPEPEIRIVVAERKEHRDKGEGERGAKIEHPVEVGDQQQGDRQTQTARHDHFLRL